MSDETGAHQERLAAGHTDRGAMREARIRHLEQLLGGIAQHLQATGNRHGDVVIQLQDRLRYLHQSTSVTTDVPDLDRHLALFEAQLTSLAIRTGVPTPAAPPAIAPQTAPQAPPVRQPQLMSPTLTADPTPPHRPATLPPIERQPQIPAQPDSPVATDMLAPPPPNHAAKAFGAPPPATPHADRPGLDALTRESSMTFEDAIAADNAARAITAAESTAVTDSDQVFTYHPPETARTANSGISQPEPEYAFDTELPLEEYPPVAVDRSSDQDIVISEPEVQPETVSLATSPDVVVADGFEEHRFQDDDAPASVSVTTRSNAENSLRSDLEAALAETPHANAEAPSTPVTYRDEPAVPPRPEPTAQTAPEPTSEPLPDIDVVGEIERLTRQIDKVSANVERLEAGLEKNRAEVPDLIKQAANAAATQVAQQFTPPEAPATEKRGERQTHELHQDSGRKAMLATPAAVSDTHPLTVEPAVESRLEHAKQSMLQRLAPVGSAIARRTKRQSEDDQSQLQPVEPRPAATTSPVSAPVAVASQHPAEHAAPPPQATPEPQVDLSSQSISSLRKSLFQNLKEGSPPALIVVFAVIAVLTSALLWNIVAGDTATPTSPDRIAQNTPVTPTDATNSTSRLPEGLDNVVQTDGQLQPTSGQAETTQMAAAPVKPAALKPDPTAPPGAELMAGGSKLELPPLATGPLSLRVAAASGDPGAQFEVAARLAQGNGVTRDPIAAVKWYTRAASSGHARAQYRLAALYERGAGVATDTGRAKIWYTRAAQQGNVKAMHNLAVLYAGQTAGSPNYVNAAQWFERAAEHGLADSQFNVAILYLNGLGVSKNLQTAYKWFALAAQQGDQEANRRLKGVKSQLKPSELNAAKRAVSAWQAKPALEQANKTIAWQPTAKSKPIKPIATPRLSLGNPKPSSKPGPIDATDIKKVQRLLNGLGYDVGSPDGRVGGKTKISIKSFQTRNGMIPTGIVDRALIGRIEAATREKAAKLGQI